MLLKVVVTQLSFLFSINKLLRILTFLMLSIKFLMRHVELNVSENLLVNDKITASCRRNGCRKHYIKRLKQQK